MLENEFVLVTLNYIIFIDCFNFIGVFQKICTYKDTTKTSFSFIKIRLLIFSTNTKQHNR